MMSISELDKDIIGYLVTNYLGLNDITRLMMLSSKFSLDNIVEKRT